MPMDYPATAHPDRYLDTLRADVRAGLTANPKTLPPKYFCDASGRSEERRVGKECRRLCRSRWSPYH